MNNQQYSVVQLAPRRSIPVPFCLSLACPSRSKKCLSLTCLSFSLHGNILFCFSFTLSLSCLSVFVCISLSLFGFCHYWESCSLSVSLPCLFYYAFPSLSLVFVTTGRAALCPFLSLACSTRSKENPYLTCTSCSILVSLSCLSSSLQIAT
jgi:hypothetical protein